MKTENIFVSLCVCENSWRLWELKSSLNGGRTGGKSVDK